jgi:hypothetical protein
MYYKYDFETDEFLFKDRKDFTNEVLNKVDNHKDIVKYFKTNTNIYKVVSKINNPRLYKIGHRHYLNMCTGLLHKSYKPYDEYDNKVKESVQMMISFFREVYCNNDESILQALLKYYKQLCQGKKTEVVIYSKAIQGVGKSTGSDFLMKYVIGEKLCLVSGTEPLLSNYNKILMGKILIIFEELPTFSEAQWCAVSSKIKTLTTEKVAVFRDLYEKSFQAENLCNFMINTNVDAIKDSQGRRYVILPLSAKYKDNHEYFENIKTKCFNIKTGEAFFSYLMTNIDNDNFYAQRDFPETENKRNVLSALLNSSYKFLKYEFLYQNKELKRTKTTDLYKHYNAYCESSELKALGPTKFYEKLDEINLKRFKTNGFMHYEASLDEIKAISKRDKWICEFDDDLPTDNIKNDENNDLEHGIVKVDLSVKVNLSEDQLQQVDEIKKEIERLNKMITKITQKPDIDAQEVDNDDDDDDEDDLILDLLK